MSLINKQLSYAPAELQLSYCGYASPAMQQMQDTIKQQLALLCYDEAKSVDELSEALQTRREFIQDAVNSMTRIKMMKQIDGKYLTLFPMLHLKKTFDCQKITNQFNQEYEIPKRINELLFSLKDKIAALDFYGNDFDISYLNWFLYTVTSNCMIEEFRSYYSDKTDEVILNKYAWSTANFDFSVCASYNYADEKVKNVKLERWLKKPSTVYKKLGGIQFINVFDSEPFPTSYDKKKNSRNYNERRNIYLNSENISFYLHLIKGLDRDFTETEEKWFEDFVKHGVIKETAAGYKPMIPVFTEEVFSELEKMLSKAVLPIVKEIAEAQDKAIEDLVLPEMYGIKERIDQMYVFWICYFLSPIQELNWYGINAGGFAVPDDYKTSVAGMYIVQ